MLKLLVLATLASTTVSSGPKIQFTNDSVYSSENIISCEVVENKEIIQVPVEHVDEVTGEITEELEEQELTSKSLLLKENHLLGCMIYDNPETEYIDGLKFDEQWVTDWVVEDYDDSVDHVLKIKTIYTEDVSGMLLAAKNGDWSRILANPLIILQIVYYIIAALSIILGGLGLAKSKKGKVKTAKEYGNEMSLKVGEAKDMMVETAMSLITPLFEHLNNQNSDIIKAFVLSKSSDNNDSLALLDLLKKTQSGEDISELVDRIKNDAENAYAKKLEAQKKAKEVVEAIANGIDNNNDVRF